MICGSGGSKSRLVKAAGAEPSGRMRNEKLHALDFKVKMFKKVRGRTVLEVWMWKNCTLLWREAHLQVKICKKMTGSDR